MFLKNIEQLMSQLQCKRQLGAAVCDSSNFLKLPVIVPAL